MSCATVSCALPPPLIRVSKAGPHDFRVECSWLSYSMVKCRWMQCLQAFLNRLVSDYEEACCSPVPLSSTAATQAGSAPSMSGLRAAATPSTLPVSLAARVADPEISRSPMDHTIRGADTAPAQMPPQLVLTARCSDGMPAPSPAAAGATPFLPESQGPKAPSWVDKVCLGSRVLISGDLNPRNSKPRKRVPYSLRAPVMRAVMCSDDLACWMGGMP